MISGAVFYTLTFYAPCLFPSYFFVFCFSFLSVYSSPSFFYILFLFSYYFTLVSFPLRLLLISQFLSLPRQMSAPPSFPHVTYSLLSFSSCFSFIYILVSRPFLVISLPFSFLTSFSFIHSLPFLFSFLLYSFDLSFPPSSFSFPSYSSLHSFFLSIHSSLS